MGIHSPVTINSFILSPSISAQVAAFIILVLNSSGAIVGVTLVNTPLLFCNNITPSACGNLPGITPPPTNKSVSPSASKSNAITQLPLDVSVGNAFIVFVKLPFPLLVYNLS